MKKIPRTIRKIETRSFYHGTLSSPPPETMQEEIAAAVERMRQEEMARQTVKIRRIEAKAAWATQLKDQMEGRWKTMREVHPERPERLLPLLATVAAFAAVVGEEALLKPVIDGFGIADPVWQHVSAFVIVVVASGLIEITLRTIRAETDRSPLLKVTSALLAVLTFGLLGSLGWWRGEELMFSGSLHAGALANFLNANQNLTKFTVLCLTVGLPVFVACALDWGLGRLRFAWEWWRTRNAFNKYSRLALTLPKQLEAQIELRDRAVAGLTQFEREKKQSYLEGYALGQRIGARRPPLWWLVPGPIAVLLGMLALCVVTEPLLSRTLTSGALRTALYILATLAVTSLQLGWTLKRWDRPTPEQLYKYRAVIWQDVGGWRSSRPPIQAR